VALGALGTRGLDQLGGGEEAFELTPVAVRHTLVLDDSLQKVAPTNERTQSIAGPQIDLRIAREYGGGVGWTRKL